MDFTSVNTFMSLFVEVTAWPHFEEQISFLKVGLLPLVSKLVGHLFFVQSSLDRLVI